MAKRVSTLDLLNKCDGFPSPERDPTAYTAYFSTLWTVLWDDEQGPYPIGYMLDAVFEQLRQVPESIRGALKTNAADKTIRLSTWQQAPSEAARTAAAARLALHWRQQHAFPILDGWRDEPWPVYARDGHTLLFSMERTAVGLLGMMRYGVHMTAYLRSGEGSSKYDDRIWVAKRAATKSTYPSMLDNTAAGGLATADGGRMFECMVREADEEASLGEDVMRARARGVGTISYVYITDARSGMADLVYPEVQWVYDLELPADGSVVPRPQDGEAEGFALCTVEEVQEQMAQGLWKPNCAVIMLDFFVRHGIVTPENEPHYDEIKRRSHRRMPFPGPHKALETGDK